jgi:hypothetical protein
MLDTLRAFIILGILVSCFLNRDRKDGLSSSSTRPRSVGKFDQH